MLPTCHVLAGPCGARSFDSHTDIGDYSMIYPCPGIGTATDSTRALTALFRRCGYFSFEQDLLPNDEVRLPGFDWDPLLTEC
jgi:hypothetical protein